MIGLSSWDSRAPFWLRLRRAVFFPGRYRVRRLKSRLRTSGLPSSEQMSKPSRWSITAGTFDGQFPGRPTGTSDWQRLSGRNDPKPFRHRQVPAGFSFRIGTLERARTRDWSCRGAMFTPASLFASTPKVSDTEDSEENRAAKPQRERARLSQPQRVGLHRRPKTLPHRRQVRACRAWDKSRSEILAAREDLDGERGKRWNSPDPLLPCGGNLVFPMVELLRSLRASLC